jgi:hypothetical protein
MLDYKQAADIDLARYKELGGTITYPFPIEDSALRVFGLDIQYEDFDSVFESTIYDPKELFGCLFPDGTKFQGIDKLILVNSNRAPFVIAGKEINKVYYSEYAERQTIAHEIGHYTDKYWHNKSEHKVFSNYQ